MQPQHQAALGEDPSESAGRSQYPISCHLRKPVLKAALRQVGLATLSGRCSLQQQMFAARQAWTSRTVKFDCGVGGAGKAFNHRVERRHSIRNSEMIIDALQFRHARPPEPMALRDGPESPDKQPLAQIKFRQSPCHRRVRNWTIHPAPEFRACIVPTVLEGDARNGPGIGK